MMANCIITYMPSACFKCVNKLAFLQSLLFVSKHLWFWGIFEGEEGVFGGEASGVACEGAVGSYHAVAWDEDADAVCPDGLRHGSDGFCVADAYGNIFVTACGAVWDLEQGVPHSLLEIGAHGA